MAAGLKAAALVLPASGQDRALALPLAAGYLVAVADGAGGTGRGAQAAQRVIAGLELAQGCVSAQEFCQLLHSLDLELAHSGGESTAVVARVEHDRVIGASVGDSKAWLLAQTMRDLTALQERKPLLGSGAARPVPIEARRAGARLLLGSDGLYKYAPMQRIHCLALEGPPEMAAAALARLVRLPSGALQDDVAVVIVCE